MNLRELQVLLSSALANTKSPAPSKTVLGTVAADEIGMARAYLSDGTTFAASGDSVNALASFFYAFGWLHFGCAFGTLYTDMKISPCPFISPCEMLPVDVKTKLVEKTGRYERLLSNARTSVICAPDPSTPAYLLAVRVLQITETSAGCGRWLLEEGRYEDALARFSYGHGWLDAGVRAGLYSITADRDLFTV